MNASKPDQLPEVFRAEIKNTDNELFVSVASLWEVAIKTSLGRNSFTFDETLAHYPAPVRC